MHKTTDAPLRVYKSIHDDLVKIIALSNPQIIESPCFKIPVSALPDQPETSVVIT